MTYFVLSLCFFISLSLKSGEKTLKVLRQTHPSMVELFWFDFHLHCLTWNEILRAIIVSIPWQVMQRPCLFSDLKIGCHIIATHQSSAMQRMLMAVCSTISWNVPQLTFIAFRAREKSRHFIFYNLNGSTHFHRC